MIVLGKTYFYCGVPIPLTISNRKVKKPNTFRLVNLYMKDNPKIGEYFLKEMMVFEDKQQTVADVLEYFKIIKIIDIEDIHKFVEKNLDVPTIINDTFREEDLYGTNGSENQTFNRQEYIGLIALSVALQLAIPVIFSAISKLINTRGVNEIITMLADVVDYIGGIGLKKLRIFIDTIIAKTKTKSSARVYKLGVTASSISDFIMGNVILSRLIALNHELDPKPQKRAPAINAIKSTIEGIYMSGITVATSVSDLVPRVEPDGTHKNSILDMFSASDSLTIDYLVAGEKYIELGRLHEDLGIKKSKYYNMILRDMTNHKVRTYPIVDYIIQIVMYNLIPPIYVDKLDIRYYAILRTVTIEWLLQNDLPVLAYIVGSRISDEDLIMGPYRNLDCDKQTVFDINTVIKQWVGITTLPMPITKADIFIDKGFVEITKKNLSTELLKLLTKEK